MCRFFDESVEFLPLFSAKQEIALIFYSVGLEEEESSTPTSKHMVIMQYQNPLSSQKKNIPVNSGVQKKETSQVTEAPILQQRLEKSWYMRKTLCSDEKYESFKRGNSRLYEFCVYCKSSYTRRLLPTPLLYDNQGLCETGPKCIGAYSMKHIIL